jgi:hypothetical protein
VVAVVVLTVLVALAVLEAEALEVLMLAQSVYPIRVQAVAVVTTVEQVIQAALV